MCRIFFGGSDTFYDFVSFNILLLRRIASLSGSNAKIYILFGENNLIAANFSAIEKKMQ